MQILRHKKKTGANSKVIDFAKKKLNVRYKVAQTTEDKNMKKTNIPISTENT